MDEPVPFRRVAIAPFDCLSQSWDRVRDQYWLLVGMTTVGIFLGTAAPMGLLMGTMMCGLYSVFLDKWRGRPAGFEGIFRGFESPLLLQSFIGTLITTIGVMVIGMPLLVVGIAAAVALGLAGRGSDAGTTLMIVGIVGVFLLWLLVVSLIGIALVFTYPLMVDRRMPALEAMKLSARAVWANLWGMLGLVLTTTILAMAGALVCCYFGAFLVMPLSFGAMTAAYVKVFGLSEAEPPSLAT